MNYPLVSQWMTTHIIKTDPTMRLHDAMRLMNRHCIRALPVVQNGQLAGIVTKRDLLRADVTTVIKESWEKYRQVGNITMEKLMTRSVICVNADDTITKAALLMQTNKIAVLPVTDAQGNLVGIVTSTDLFRMLIEESESLSKPVEVADYMSRELTTVAPMTVLLDAQRLMAVNNIRALPVVQNGLLIGIVTRTDLMSAAPGAATDAEYEVTKQILSTPMRFMMTSSPITVDENAPITKAAQLMSENKIHSLPVMDAKGNLAGMITESDLFRFIVEKFSQPESLLK
ncbi:MAG: CBS domain-containing protein [Anaerolineaceae bacterium]|nr:CBS domain-containing protein [Anaerolineaceae bacterium]